MDATFSEEENAFRSLVRDFFRRSVPPRTRRKLLENRILTKEEIVEWQRILNAKGWATPHWPVEYGGTNWTVTQRYIFQEELQMCPAPEPLSFGVKMVGPIICAFGSEWQKKRFLSKIANLEEWWCQGFSEPGAGSDLASLTTSARLSGDQFVVRGQKTWTTLAQHADWIFCLVRTEPAAKKQDGISFLLIDMRSPGIAVRPIQTFDGGFEINEVFFDDVIVPRENLVGEINKGWNYAKFLLGNERTGIARVGTSKERIQRIRALAAKLEHNGAPMIQDERFRERLAALEIELKALEITQLRVLSADSRHTHGKPDPASSILKLKGTELQQSAIKLMLDLLGPLGLAYRPDAIDSDEPDFFPDWSSQIGSSYFNNRKITIYGGSSEIQRTIIAKNVLGL